MARNDVPPGLIKWAYREEWREALDAALDAHFLPVCDEFDLEEDRLHEILGEAASAALWTCAFEDFATTDDETRGVTIVDDYLKRRGWKESVSTRRYLEALRGSVMSIHEVGEVAAADSFLARDLVLGGEPVRVHDAAMSRVLKQGDTIAMRVLDISGRRRMSGGALLFEAPAAEKLRADLALELAEMEKVARAEPGALEAAAALRPGNENPMRPLLLMELAPLVSFAWMEHFLEDVPDEERMRPAAPAERKPVPRPKGFHDWE